MNAVQQENYTKNKSNKTLSTTKSKKTFLTQINSFIKNIKNFFIWLINQINSLLSKCSMLTHFTLILVPVSILFIVLIFYIHLNFYDSLFRFNYYKGVKEEFLDHYITEIDDMHSELETFLIKESYLDLENILFFEIYFKELSSIGLLDNSSEKIFPDIHNTDIYKELDEFYSIINMDIEYSVDDNEAIYYVDERNDSLKEFAKIYYYMLPVINYGIYFSGVYLDQTFLIAYEFDKEERNIEKEELFFAYPKIKQYFNKGNNFKPIHGYLSPKVSKTKYERPEMIENRYYNDNFFIKQDWDFRNFINLDQESWSIISFNHLNIENNGNITKNLDITLQLNINRNDRHFIINIIFRLKQKEDIKDETIDYSAFIIRNISEYHNFLNDRYSDNDTFVISQQEFTEYSLSIVDNNFFHYGLFDNNYNFFKNGVSFDSFNLNLLFDPFKNYNTVDGFSYDLKYLSTLYLYMKLFQNIQNSDYKKEGEEISVYQFDDEEKVKNICKELNLTNYIEYIKEEKEIDCWDPQNKLYYNDDYKDAPLFDSYTSLPYCVCLPLYCLNNYKTLKNDKYEFSDDNLVSKINLPDRCQNKFSYFLNENEPKYIDSYAKSMSSVIFYLFNPNTKTPEQRYVKIQKENIDELPGYYLLVFSEITSNTHIFFTFFIILLIKWK